MRLSIPGPAVPVTDIPVHWIILNFVLLTMAFGKLLFLMRVFLKYQSLIALLMDVFSEMKNFCILYGVAEMHMIMCAWCLGADFDMSDYEGVWYPLAYFLAWFRCSIGDINAPSLAKGIKTEHK
jgi:hypothetical protein